ncbi:MAG: tyrosine-type recombinase/integrase [candidate division NC10 bacterium]|nr:tyrosine-type recombinase/integrase [candidate division NC10 bacterium]
MRRCSHSHFRTGSLGPAPLPAGCRQGPGSSDSTAYPVSFHTSQRSLHSLLTTAIKQTCLIPQTLWRPAAYFFAPGSEFESHLLDCKSASRLARCYPHRVRLPPHALRHTYASLLIQPGVSLAFVQKQLGHASIQTTVDVYGHLVPLEGRQGIESLAVFAKRNPDATDPAPGTPQSRVSH